MSLTPKLELTRHPQDRGVRCSCTRGFTSNPDSPATFIPASIGRFRSGPDLLEVFFRQCPTCGESHVVITGVGYNDPSRQSV